MTKTTVKLMLVMIMTMMTMMMLMMMMMLIMMKLVMTGRRRRCGMPRNPASLRAYRMLPF